MVSQIGAVFHISVGTTAATSIHGATIPPFLELVSRTPLIHLY